MKHFTLALMAVAAMCTQTFAQSTRNFYTSSLKLNVEAIEAATQPVQVNRTLFAGYNTICLPMGLSAEQLQAAAPDVQVERLAAVRQEGSVLNMYFLDCTNEGIEAGKPYLIFTPKTQTLKALSTNSKGINTQLQSVTMSDGKGNQVTFGSSWESLQVEGRYGIPAQQDAYILESILIRTEADKTFLPTRCGFTWDSQTPTATKLEIKHVSNLAAMETSIEKLQATDATVDVYSTQGTLVKKQVSINSALQSLPRGVYVIGGEKVAVK